MNKYQMLIDGAWVNPSSEEWFESTNPFTASPWALVPKGSKADVDLAVEAAHKAFYGDWRKMTATARGALLRKLGDLIEVMGWATKRTRSLVFTQCRGEIGEKLVFTATSIQKIIGA